MIHSFPPAFEERMRTTLGEQWNDFSNAHQQDGPTSLRINPAKPVRIEYSDRIPWTRFGFYLRQRPSFTRDPLFHAGTYYVQEASSMFLEQALLQSVDVNQSLTILDVSAAPGGKSTHLASLINDKSLLVSNEVIRSRANILVENIQKWGVNNIIVTNNDPEDFNSLGGFFDVVVVDAPCSGEGLFRKDPEAMTQWSAENVSLCASRQRRIVTNVWPCLKENGIFIYCTCTFNEFENEENLSWLASNEDIEFVDLNIDPAWGVEKVIRGNVMGYRFYPHKVKGEGFFLSVMRKLAATDEIRVRSGKNRFAAPAKKTIEQLDRWINAPQHCTFIQRDDLIQALPKEKTAHIEFLTNYLSVVYAGTYIATVKHDKLIPEHALALSVLLNKDSFHVIELTLDQALQYLRKETLNLDIDYKGFALVTYDNQSLGWVNVLQNRINNLYPSNWRIRNV